MYIRQFGGPSHDFAQAAAIHSGSTYVAGYTMGALPGQASSWGQDAFLRRYDSSGAEVWTRQFGSSGDDVAAAIVADSGGVYVAGSTSGALPGQTAGGSYDAFVRKYDLAGNELWTRQFGTSGIEQALGAAVDATGVYIAGYTSGTLAGQTSAGGPYDAFLAKYDLNGNPLWMRQFGSAGIDTAYAVSAAGGAIYVAGDTTDALAGPGSYLGGYDAFVRKYDSGGAAGWTRQFGTGGTDSARRIAADASGFYLAGSRNGPFFGRYDATGVEQWSRQLAYPLTLVSGVAASGGGVLISGEASGALPGQTGAGGRDVFIRGYDGSGNEVWTRQFGSAGSDFAAGLAADAGSASLSGSTDGVLAGQTSAGGADAFAVAISVAAQSPPPAVTAREAIIEVNEARPAHNSGTFTAATPGDPVTITASLGRVEQAGNSSGYWHWFLPASDGPMNRTVTITAADGKGGAASASFQPEFPFWLPVRKQYTPTPPSCEPPWSVLIIREPCSSPHG
ncbi:MAG: hypothetical protein FJW37_09860, partial [Acidobacteria bacterium]|nr:hypothetical protein [Acidobacteriota bacterium]